MEDWVRRTEWVLAALILLATARCPAQQTDAAKAAPSRPAHSQLAQTAIIQEQQGKYVEAEVTWRQVVKADPRNAAAYAHLGLLEARQEHYKEAVPLYRKALMLNPTIPGVKLDLGLAQFKGGELKEATKTFDALLKQQPGDQRVTILAAMGHYGLGEYAEATPYLKEAALHDKSNLPLRLTLAHSCLWSKQFQCVLDVYHEMLALNAESAETDMLAGEALDALKDGPGAVEQFRAAVRANPKEPNVHFGLGYLLWTQKQYDEAISEFKAELQNDPKSYQAMTYLGDAYVQQAQFDQAKPVLEEAAALQSSIALAHLDLGIVLAEAGDKDAAARELNKAIGIDPDNVTAHFRLARLYRAMGRNADAKAESSKASSLNKKTEEGLYKQIFDAGGRPDPHAKNGAANLPAQPDLAKPEKP